MLSGGSVEDQQSGYLVGPVVGLYFRRVLKASNVRVAMGESYMIMYVSGMTMYERIAVKYGPTWPVLGVVEPMARKYLIYIGTATVHQFL